MGNCLRHQSPGQWAGEDWESPENNAFRSKDIRRHGRTKSNNNIHSSDEEDEEKVFLGQKRNFNFSSSSSPATTTEVKVKITKKQLEELLGTVDLKELSVQQVLAQLMNVSDCYEAHQRSWRPALQSIPEAELD